MAVDFDAELTRLAARIWRNAAGVYSRSGDETWLSGYNPVLTAWNSGLFDDLEMTRGFQAVSDPFSSANESSWATGGEEGRCSHATLKRVFGLPCRLPAVRLPPSTELAASARSAPFMVKLEELARWLGRDGRPVTRDRQLHGADAVDAVHWLNIRPNLLPYLWEHALVTGWFELVDGPDGYRSWAVLGKTAYRWAEGDILGALYVWSTVFASVLARTLEVNADQAPDAARLLDFQGQGVALAVMLFLARRTGLTAGDASDVIQDGAIGDPPTGRAKRAWDAWVSQFGDPARPLLRELAALHALTLPPNGDGILTLSPLAQGALRAQFMLDDIDIPVIPALGDLSAADLVELADVIRNAEFREESEAWFSRRNPGRAARDLLMYAASADARARLTAVNLVRRMGMAAGGAWVEAMGSPQLRGYARMALSGIATDPPGSRLPPLRNPDPDEMDAVAADLLSLIGGDDPDPGRVAVRFTEVIPAGEEGRAFGLLARSTHPDTRRLLELLGLYHPDRNIAREARKAARAAAKNGSSAQHEPMAGPRRQLTGPVSRSTVGSPPGRFQNLGSKPSYEQQADHSRRPPLLRPPGGRWEPRTGR